MPPASRRSSQNPQAQRQGCGCLLLIVAVLFVVGLVTKPSTDAANVSEPDVTYVPTTTDSTADPTTSAAPTTTVATAPVAASSGGGRPYVPYVYVPYVHHRSHIYVSHGHVHFRI